MSTRSNYEQMHSDSEGETDENKVDGREETGDTSPNHEHTPAPRHYAINYLPSNIMEEIAKWVRDQWTIQVR